MNKIEIPLANGHKIVAEFCEYGYELPPEIAICFQDKDGCVFQDIVLVRAKQVPNGVPIDINIGAEVLVWADENNEDYTDRFQIDEYDFEEE